MTDDGGPVGEPAEMSQNTKVELAKLLLAVKSTASDEAYRQVRDILVRPDATAAVEKAVQGLSKEDEFAIICRMIGTTSHLVHLEQRPVIKGDFLVPDFLACFQPGCFPGGRAPSEARGFRCLVEVKSTTKEEFKIGGSRLRRLRSFADRFGLPLVFAVRALGFEEYALWLLVEDDRSRTAITVTVAALGSGLRHVLWDDYLMMVYPWVCLRTVHDTAAPAEEGTAARHETYGRLCEFHIASDPAHPISGERVRDNVLRLTGDDAFMYSAFFEAFRPQEVHVRKCGTRTVSVLQPTSLCSVVDMLYIFNRLGRHEDGRVAFDPSRILAGGMSDAGLITRDLVDSVASSLWGWAMGYVTWGRSEDHLAKWERLCGQPGAEPQARAAGVPGAMSTS